MNWTGLTLVVDVDGTLCPIRSGAQSYSDLIPYDGIVERLRTYHEAGARIVIYSSRNMNTFAGNLGLINKNTAPVMLEWLNRYGIPYDEIVFGKVWPGGFGFYVDDRAVRPLEFMTKTPDELEELCDSQRLG